MSAGADRGARLASLVAEKELDALIVGDLVRPGDSGPDAMANIRWLTGFGGTSGLAIVGSESRIFITDFRYAERVARDVDGGFQAVIAKQQLLPTLAGMVHGKVGFDEGHTSVRALRKLRDEVAGDTELVPTEGLVESLRRAKDPAEIESIAAAARITDQTYQWLAERGFAGRTEREVALDAEVHMRELGADGPSFGAIVAAGANAAIPHHEPSEREIKSGQLLLIDMGSIVDGYCSDATRTLAVGEVGEEERTVYELVKQAQQVGLDSVSAGVDGKEADADARAPIDDAGYGEKYGHGLGHGVGIEVHEAPRMGKTSEDTLAEGDVVSVEPGIYLAGRFGVRIEDIVAVEADGNRNLTGFTKELLVVE
jgi:Xaa-Pro aminopeptidase